MMSPIHCLHTLVQFNCYDVVLCLRDEIEVFLDRLVTGQVGPPCCVYLCSCLTATDLSVSHKVLNESRPSPGCLHHAAFVSVVFNLFVFFCLLSVGQFFALFQKHSTALYCQPTFYGHYTGQSALAAAPPVKNWRILLVQFFCPHALADSNHRVQIREKMLEFSTV